MAADALTSERVDVDLHDAIEACYERGWTDGLPVVPPTEDRVAAFLEAAGNQPADVLGVVETRGRVITAEKAAINAVMAGCLPEYMPVINAVIRAMTTPEFNWHGSIASTGGSAQLIVVGGPIAKELGVNHGVNLFGPGFRPNATIGRAVRLIIMNVTGGTPGLLDRSTFGFGGKYSFVIAEDEEASPWEPLHVQRGLDPGESAITVYAAHSPTQFIDHSSNTPEGLIASAADAMRPTGANHNEFVVVWSPEHILRFRQAGWTKRQAMEALFHEAHGSVKEIKARARGEDVDLRPIVSSPDGVIMLVGGGNAGGFSIVVSPWGAGYMSQSVTQAVERPS